MSLEKEGPLRGLGLIGLGEAYMNIDEFEKAEQLLNESERIQPDLMMRSYSYLWWLSSIQGKFEESIVRAKSVCTIDEYICLALLGASYTWIKDFEKGLNYFNKSQNESRERNIYNRSDDASLIYIHLQLGNKEKAKQLLEEAVNYWKGSELIQAFTRIGEAYAAFGDVDNAMFYLRQSRTSLAFFSFMTHCPYFESVWDNEEFKDLITTKMEEKEKIKEEVSRMEAIGEL